MAYKLAATPLEYSALLKSGPSLRRRRRWTSYLAERDLEDHGLECAPTSALIISRVGLSGSPTKVLKVNFVVLEGDGSKEFEASQEGLL